LVRSTQIEKKMQRLSPSAIRRKNKLRRRRRSLKDSYPRLNNKSNNSRLKKKMLRIGKRMSKMISKM
jgi:hypothetical protein